MCFVLVVLCDRVLIRALWEVLARLFEWAVKVPILSIPAVLIFNVFFFTSSISIAYGACLFVEKSSFGMVPLSHCIVLVLQGVRCNVRVIAVGSSLCC